MTIHAYSSKQHGVALILSLIMFSIASLGAIIGMQVALTEEKIASNQIHLSRAIMGAESGALVVTQWFMQAQPTATQWPKNSHWAQAQDLDLTGCHYLPAAKSPLSVEVITCDALQGLAAEAQQPPLHGSFLVGNGHWKLEKILFFHQDIHGNKVAANHAQAQQFLSARIKGKYGLATRMVEIKVMQPMPDTLHPAFLIGMVADADIHIHDVFHFWGSAHTNGSFYNDTLASTVENRTKTDAQGNVYHLETMVSAHKALHIKGSYNTRENANRMQIPAAYAYIEARKAQAIEQCIFDSGDLQGKVYFCAGHLHIDASTTLHNGTIMVEGNVIFNGASVPDEADIMDFMLVAGGEINMSPSGDNHGVYWSDGNFNYAGGQSLGGVVVSSGEIRIEGQFNYTQYDDFGSLLLPQQSQPYQTAFAWREVF